MKQWLALLAGVTAVGLSAISVAEVCQVKDDLGHTITLTHSASRIISLSPDLTETLFAIGAGRQVIGVIRGSDYPSSVRAIPIVGHYAGLDLEKLMVLKPDLVVTWGHVFSRQLALLQSWGVPVYHADPHHLDDEIKTIKNLGCLTGQQQQANSEAQAFHSMLTQLKHHRDHKPVKVFYRIGRYSWITINKDSWINEMIETCGGVNVFANARTAAPEVSMEAVIAAEPDVIISDVSDPDMTSWRKWQSVPAVKKHQFLTVNPDLFERMGPRTLEGAKQLCDYLASI